MVFAGCEMVGVGKRLYEGGGVTEGEDCGGRLNLFSLYDDKSK